MKTRNVTRVLFAIVAAASAVGACSDTTGSVSSNCVPGVTRACDADAGCQIAIEECTGSPPAWGPCHCIFASPADSAPPRPPEVDAGPPLVGTYCHSDRDCASGAFCLNRASNYFLGGGPPKGVCVADCSADPTVCRHFANATCVRVAPSDSPTNPSADSGRDTPDSAADASSAGSDATPGPVDAARDPTDSGPKNTSDAGRDSGSDAAPSSTVDAAPDAHRDGAPHIADARASDARTVPPARVPTSLCMKSCSLGPGPAVKCYGVANVACAPLPSGSGNDGYCRPLCASNADCASTADGPARACDVRSGVCVNAPGNVDVALGRTCDGPASDCQGECIPLEGSGTGTSICSHACVIGVPSDCGESTTDAFAGACLETPAGRSAGDIGYCRKLCNCPEECGASNLVCVGFDNPDYQLGFKRYGVCTPNSLVTGEVLKCK